MSEVFSYSRIECFNKCKLHYKYRYIDGLSTEVETIEAFMGKRVHEVLKEFYDFIKHTVIKPKEWMLKRYDELWQRNFHSSVKVVKNELDVNVFYEKGKKCLSDYYDRYLPFDQAKTVKTEEKIMFPLRAGGEEVQFFGILDRIDWNDRENLFEIHDYKTSSSLISQEEADTDLQLPLYQLALMNRWPEAENARLTWHFLLFNKKIESFRTKEQLEELSQIFIEKIRDIRSCQSFPPEKSALCDWCEFQEICPLWKHPKRLEKVKINEYRKDPGVVLVSKYAKLEEEKKELKKKLLHIEEEEAKIEEAAIALAEKENISLIDGPDKQLLVTAKKELRPPTRKESPEKWEGLRDILLQEGKYEEVSTVNHNMLAMRLKKWPGALVDKIRRFLIIKVTKKVTLINKESNNRK
ncbi:MAG: RecB family exonuclease [Candidatus Aminicenantales bacterium]